MSIRRLKEGNGTITGVKKKRKGVHAKSKRSLNKSGNNWVKPYKGQGR